MAASLIIPIPGKHRWRMHGLVRHYARARALEDPKFGESVDLGRTRVVIYYGHMANEALGHVAPQGKGAPSTTPS